MSQSGSAAGLIGSVRPEATEVLGKEWEGRLVDNRFPLLQYLGGSDHGAVFLTGLGQSTKAAIKLMRLRREHVELALSSWAKVARLSHPHLIRIFEMGRCEIDGVSLIYVVMEYAEENLSQVLRQRALTPEESQDMLREVVDVLAYLHDSGFVHGRIKPANIMASGDQLKISSDELCAADESRQIPLKASAYDAPEIAGGAIQPAADIWSLGITLVEALTQSRPMIAGPELDASILSEAIPATLSDIIRHCLRREPERRWTTAEIAARLQLSAPATQVIVPRKQERISTRRYIILAAAMAVLLAVILAKGKLWNRQPETHHVRAITSQLPSIPTPESGSGASTPLSTEGAVTERILPKVSASARATITGKVKVKIRVAVDPSGKVVNAKFESPGPSQYFARLAMQAAQNWKFRAPTANGQPVPSEWILRFEFGRTATNATQLQARP